VSNNLDIIKRRKKSSLVLVGIGYIFTLFLLLHFYRSFLEIKDLSKLNLILDIMNKNIENKPLFFPTDQELKLALIITIGFCIYGLMIITDTKKFMPGSEHGSARWATEKEKMKLRNKKEEKNIILTDDVYMSLNDKKIRKNHNVLIVGGSGTGKTRFYVKPNLMQLNTSYIVTDPKGDLFRETGKLMQDNGYVVKVFNIKDMASSMCYNPFKYIKKDTDIFKLIKVLIKNTNGNGKSGDDPFWEKAETALLQAIFFYLYYEAPDYEQNLPMVAEMLESARIKEEDEDYKSDLDILFKELEEKNPNHIALKQYKVFKTGAGKTGKSILISAMSRLAFLSIGTITKLFSKDELELELMGDRKTILYVIIPDSDTSFNFIVAMLYTQMFDVLYNRADTVHKGSLPVKVRCIFDEFANTGEIPDYKNLLATMRSRGISSSIILQSIEQIKGMYKDTWKAIVDNCDSFLFLGGQETAEYVSKRLGKMTIDSKVTNKSRGKNGSSSINYSILGRELLTAREVEEIKDNDCILFIRAMSPFYSKKFRIERHKKYKELGSENGNDPNNFYFKDIKKKIKLEKFNTEKLSLDLNEIKELEYELEYE